MNFLIKQFQTFNFKNFILLILSFIFCTFSQNAWFGFLSYFNNFCGFLLFWLFLNNSKLSKMRKFKFSFLFFLFLSFFQLSWLTSTKYQGFFILVFYVLISSFLAVQFACLCLLVSKKKLNFIKILFIASLWTLLEYSRSFILCGFTWNLVGLSLTNNLYSFQLASILGVYGLSFWYVLTNLIGFKAFFAKKKKYYFLWAFFYIFPYLLGFLIINLHSNKNLSNEISSILVQPGFSPEQKGVFGFDHKLAIKPIDQWKQIIKKIDKVSKNKKIDLIVFPESSPPMSGFSSITSIDKFIEIFENIFDENFFTFFPPLEKPFCQNLKIFNKNNFFLTNAFISQFLANYYKATVVIGMDREEDEKVYNSAFCFTPKSLNIQAYDKQILVPIGEYIPFKFLKKIAKKYNIYDSFTKGKSAKIFENDFKFSTSICYEETYSRIIRKQRILGSNLFINLTNDGWFPNSKLPIQHLDHGKIRAVENGVPTLRACNTGVTASINCFGKIVDKIENSKKTKVIFTKISSYSYKTLYSFWGDSFIIGFSILMVIFYSISQILKKMPLLKIF